MPTQTNIRFVLFPLVNIFKKRLKFENKKIMETHKIDANGVYKWNAVVFQEVKQNGTWVI